MSKATKKNLSVHFSSASDNWATPQKVFDELNAKYGPFELDVCADASNAKCFFYLDKFSDDLFRGWRYATDPLSKDPRHSASSLSSTYYLFNSVWMNPPYGRTIGLWIKKAYEESLKGCRVVCLLPARTDTKWFHDYCLKGKVEFLKGRLKFGDAKNSAPFPSMVVVFDPPK